MTNIRRSELEASLPRKVLEPINQKVAQHWEEGKYLKLALDVPAYAFLIVVAGVTCISEILHHRKK